MKEPPETFKGKSLASAGEGTDTIQGKYKFY